MTVAPSRPVGFEGWILTAMLAFPTLLGVHQAPQAVFYSEWLAALALLALLGASALSREGPPAFSPAVLLLWTGFALAAFWPRAWAVGGPDNAVGYVLYFGLFALAAALVRGKGAQWAATPVAMGLVICALAQSALAFCQLFDIELGGIVLKKAYAAVFGNVGQSNHFANLCWIGLAGLLYLFGRGRVSGGMLVVLAIWLNLLVAASGSRAAWLYIALFLFVACWLALRRKGSDVASGFWPAAALIVAAGVGAQLAASLGLFERFGLLSAAERLAAQGSNGQRLHDWRVALGAMAQHPLLGAGPGSFYKLTVDAAVGGPELPFPMFGENAHNLLLQLASELGTPLALLVLALGCLWLTRVLAAEVTAERVLALCGLGVISLHAMVEYPFWYTYFVIPAGLCWGLGESASGVKIILPRAAAAGVFLVGATVLVWMLHDWSVVRRAHATLEADDLQWADPQIPRVRHDLATVSAWSPYADQARVLAIQAWKPEKAGAAAVARECDLRWRVLPDWTAMIQCANAYAGAGRVEDTRQIVTALCRGFPTYHKLLGEWFEREPDLGGVRPETLACLGGKGI